MNKFERLLDFIVRLNHFYQLAHFCGLVDAEGVLFAELGDLDIDGDSVLLGLWLLERLR